MSEKIKEVEKMIAKVMTHRDCARQAAIDYMLTVATGRLLALKRYESSVPEGKKHKGILTLAGPKKKRADKTPALTRKLAAADEPAKPAKAPKAPRKPRKKTPKPEVDAVSEAAQ